MAKKLSPINWLADKFAEQLLWWGLPMLASLLTITVGWFEYVPWTARIPLALAGYSFGLVAVVASVKAKRFFWPIQPIDPERHTALEADHKKALDEIRDLRAFQQKLIVQHGLELKSVSTQEVDQLRSENARLTDELREALEDGRRAESDAAQLRISIAKSPDNGAAASINGNMSPSDLRASNITMQLLSHADKSDSIKTKDDLIRWLNSADTMMEGTLKYELRQQFRYHYTSGDEPLDARDQDTLSNCVATLRSIALRVSTEWLN